MAINVTIGESKTKEKPFPKLMISLLTDNVVLFSSPKEGMVVLLGKRNKCCYEIGEYAKDFTMDNFTDYNEPITLQNQ